MKFSFSKVKAATDTLIPLSYGIYLFVCYFDCVSVRERNCIIYFILEGYDIYHPINKVHVDVIVEEGGFPA